MLQHLDFRCTTALALAASLLATGCIRKQPRDAGVSAETSSLAYVSRLGTKQITSVDSEGNKARSCLYAFVPPNISRQDMENKLGDVLKTGGEDKQRINNRTVNIAYIFTSQSLLVDGKSFSQNPVQLGLNGSGRSEAHEIPYSAREAAKRLNAQTSAPRTNGSGPFLGHRLAAPVLAAAAGGSLLILGVSSFGFFGLGQTVGDPLVPLTNEVLTESGDAAPEFFQSEPLAEDVLSSQQVVPAPANDPLVPTEPSEPPAARPVDLEITGQTDGGTPVTPLTAAQVQNQAFESLVPPQTEPVVANLNLAGGRDDSELRKLYKSIYDATGSLRVSGPNFGTATEFAAAAKLNQAQGAYLKNLFAEAAKTYPTGTPNKTSELCSSSMALQLIFANGIDVAAKPQTQPTSKPTPK